MTVTRRRARREDLAFITTLERRPDNQEYIGQWTDAEHLVAIDGVRGREHWIIERDGAPAGYMIVFPGPPEARSVYLKRILVDAKERGTGQEAVARFLEDVFSRPGVEFAWLTVLERNARAQAVYRKMGFARYEPASDEAAMLRAYAEEPDGESFRMRVNATAWQARRAR